MTLAEGSEQGVVNYKIMYFTTPWFRVQWSSGDPHTLDFLLKWTHQLNQSRQRQRSIQSRPEVSVHAQHGIKMQQITHTHTHTHARTRTHTQLAVHTRTMCPPVAREARKPADALDNWMCTHRFSLYSNDSGSDIEWNRSRLAPDYCPIHTTSEAMWIDSQCTPCLHHTERIGHTHTHTRTHTVTTPYHTCTHLHLSRDWQNRNFRINTKAMEAKQQW